MLGITRYQAKKLGGVIGEVKAFPFSEIESGYLECNGALLNRLTYAKLFAKIGETFGEGDGALTFSIPDLRGEFIRGFDNGKGIDNGRVIGSYQADEFKRHNHHIGDSDSAGNTSNTGLRGAGSASYVSSGYAGGSETRPRNIAMMYCIKYK